MIFLRADGNSKVGVGHLMRCLSIAMYARDRGEEAVFFSASDDFKDIIKVAGIVQIVLNTDYTEMESELDLLKNKILEKKPCAVFVQVLFEINQ